MRIQAFKIKTQSQYLRERAHDSRIHLCSPDLHSSYHRFYGIYLYREFLSLLSSNVYLRAKCSHIQDPRVRNKLWFPLHYLRFLIHRNWNRKASEARVTPRWTLVKERCKTWQSVCCVTRVSYIGAVVTFYRSLRSTF